MTVRCDCAVGQPTFVRRRQLGLIEIETEAAVHTQAVARQRRL